MTVNATCPECGEHLRNIGTGNGHRTTDWLACDTCGLSWSEDELDTIVAERDAEAVELWTEPNRWTAVVKSTGRVLLLDGGVAALSVFGDADQAESLAAQINRTPSVNLDELKARWPEGFCWCPDDEDERHGTGCCTTREDQR